MNTALLGLLLCCTVLRRMKWVFDWQQIDFMQRLWGIKSVRVDLLTILCNQETVHFIFSRTASPQLHLKHGFWNSADIYVFTLKSSLGEICCLFVVWGGSNGDGPEMELDLKKSRMQKLHCDSEQDDEQEQLLPAVPSVWQTSHRILLSNDMPWLWLLSTRRSAFVSWRQRTHAWLQFRAWTRCTWWQGKWC